MIAMECVSPGESCQWNQYLGDPGRTAYAGCSAPESAEVLWEVTLDGVSGMPFIIGDKVIVLSQFYSFFPSELESAPPSNVTVIDLLTGALLKKVVPEKEPVGVYPVGGNVLIDAGTMLYELDLSSEEVVPVSQIPGRCFCLSGCHPVILADRIIFPTTPVVCLSRDDYHTVWNLETSLGPLYPENAEIKDIAASANQVVIILEEKEGKKLLAVDTETGELIWMKNLMATRVATDGSVGLVGGDNVYAIDAETGKPLWIFEVEYTWSNIAVGPHAVYFTDAQNYLYAVDKETGQLKWKSPWEEGEWITYIIEAEDTIICSNILNLTVFSAKDGSTLWSLHFRDYSGPFPDKPCPALADGILIVPRKELQQGDSFVIMRPEQLTALASDPDLFRKQGDAFLSRDLRDKAIGSYEKAAELYERKGDISRTQEIQERIRELENYQESLSSTPETVSRAPSSPVSELTKSVSPLFILIIIVAIIGISIATYFARRRGY